MANVFVSYGRASIGRTRPLVSVLERQKHRVWFDQHMVGGQPWWNQILKAIRDCDVCVVALSPEVLESRACTEEWRYAVRLGKPVLPVMISTVSPNLLPKELAALQIVDYRQPSIESASDLAAAFRDLPPAGELPNPLPEPPPLPVSLLAQLRETIERAEPMGGSEQQAVLLDLKTHLQDPEARADAALLLRRFAQRPDLVHTIHREALDNLAPLARLAVWLRSRTRVQWSAAGGSAVLVFGAAWVFVSPCNDTVRCEPGLTECSNSCRDIQTDDANCGSCGTVCASAEICKAGRCRPWRPDDRTEEREESAPSQSVPQQVMAHATDAGMKAVVPADARTPQERDAGDDKSTVARRKQECDQGIARQCAELGAMYEHGAGIRKDTARAAALYKRGCDDGSAVCCSSLGAMYRDGIGVEKDAAQAFALSKKGCEGGDARGCVDLGFLYAKGIGVARDDALAAAFYGKGCDGGNAFGCTNLGIKYRNGSGVAKDDARAATLYSRGCDGNHALGCTNLGILYQQGSGVAKDDARAATLYKKGCDGGSALGCTNLGMLYDDGNGVAKDPARAAALYKRGCDGKYTLGCTKLGFSYEHGSGVAKDPARAAALYKQACDGGNAPGCTSLGVMHENGSGVAQAAPQAAVLYKRGCDGNHAPGCTHLGFLYEHGKGVAKDAAQAAALYKQGCDGGSAPGCTYLDAMQREVMSDAGAEAAKDAAQ